MSALNGLEREAMDGQSEYYAELSIGFQFMPMYIHTPRVRNVWNGSLLLV